MDNQDKSSGLLDRYRQRLSISAAEGNTFIKENLDIVLDIYNTPSVIPEFYLNSYIEHLWDNRDKKDFIEMMLLKILSKDPHHQSDYAIARNYVSMYEDDPEFFKTLGFSMDILKQCVTLIEQNNTKK